MKQKIILTEKGVKEVVRMALQNQFKTGDISADIPCLDFEEFGELNRKVNEILNEREINYGRVSDKRIAKALSDLNISIELPQNFER